MCDRQKEEGRERREGERGEKGEVGVKERHLHAEIMDLPPGRHSQKKE